MAAAIALAGVLSTVKWPEIPVLEKGFYRKISTSPNPTPPAANPKEEAGSVYTGTETLRNTRIGKQGKLFAPMTSFLRT
jgi:hypothetical protein